MASIQNSPHPLAFKTKPGLFAPLAASGHAERDAIRVRVYARALDGMQKEALVHYGPTGVVWRLTSDEGPYLNGTDLAPFPLAFFTTGLVSSYVSELLALARQRALPLGRLRVTVDNQYTMEGSAFHGTMTGGALPVELSIEHESPDAEGAMIELASQAVAGSPAGSLLLTKLENAFSLFNRDRQIPVAAVRAHECPMPFPAEDVFGAAAPAAPNTFAQEIIRKLETAQNVFGVEGGAGSSLKAEQKRSLHVRGVCTVRDDGLKSVRIQLFKPIGSVFEFLSDDPETLGGGGRAPSGLAYLCAGVAFCYLTQVGRYAAIRKLDLDGYRVVQDAAFSLPGASGKTSRPGTASALATHLTLETGEDDTVSNDMLRMGEQTCFLHAACRSEVKTRIRVSRRMAEEPST